MSRACWFCAAAGLSTGRLRRLLGHSRLRAELLNETLVISIVHAHEAFAAWADDYNTKRPHLSLGSATPALYAGES